MNVIRKATLTDLDKVVELFDAYRVFYGKVSDYKNARLFLYDRFIENDSVIYIAETNSVLTGFVQLYPLFSSTRMKKLWLLNDLFVEESSRGRGISLALIEQCKALCRESQACGMFLETAKSNEIGNQLYPKAGFTFNTDHNFYDWNVES